MGYQGCYGFLLHGFGAQGEDQHNPKPLTSEITLHIVGIMILADKLQVSSMAFCKWQKSGKTLNSLQRQRHFSGL